MIKKSALAPVCPVQTMISVLGGKWKLALVHHLTQGTCRFNELRRKATPITQQMLTIQLRELEENGIIDRKVYPQIPPRVEYSLTPMGRTLEPVLAMMNTWAKRYVASRK